MGWDKFSVSLQGCTSNPTPIWDELGCGGMTREGVAIAGLADIARHRRDRKINLTMRACEGRNEPSRRGPEIGDLNIGLFFDD